jgi:hypothetical protein
MTDHPSSPDHDHSGPSTSTGSVNNVETNNLNAEKKLVVNDNTVNTNTNTNNVNTVSTVNTKTNSKTNSKMNNSVKTNSNTNSNPSSSLNSQINKALLDARTEVGVLKQRLVKSEV